MRCKTAKNNGHKRPLTERQIEENFQKNSKKIAISDPKRHKKLKVQNYLKSPLRALDESNEEFKVL